MIKSIIFSFGRGLRVGLIAIGALAFVGTSIGLADYSLTQGSGTTFASLVISLKHYAAYVMCDATAGESQCAAVDNSGNVAVKDAAVLAAVQAAVPALNATNYNTNSYSNAGTSPVNADLNGNIYVHKNDPCQQLTKSYANVNLNGTTGTYTTPIVAGASSKKTYICQITLNNNAAVNVAIVEATTSTSCGTVTAGLFGGTTAATGFQFAANGGVALGQGGYSIKGTVTNNDDICAITSGTTQISGSVAYVQQ